MREAPVRAGEPVVVNVALGQRGYDIVIGSRNVDRRFIEKHQSWFREFGGVVFNLAVRALLRLNFRDTQCGFKLFRRDAARRVFPLQRLDGLGGQIFGNGRRHALRQDGAQDRDPNSCADRPC